MLALSNPAPTIVYGQRVNCFEVTFGSSATSASEKENLLTERKQNYVIRNENRKKLSLLLLEQQKNGRSSIVFSSKLACPLS